MDSDGFDNILRGRKADKKDKGKKSKDKKPSSSKKKEESKYGISSITSKVFTLHIAKGFNLRQLKNILIATSLFQTTRLRKSKLSQH